MGKYVLRINCALYLSHIRHSLQLSDLGERVMPESLMKGCITILVRDIQVRTLPDQQTNDLRVLAFNS